MSRVYVGGVYDPLGGDLASMNTTAPETHASDALAGPHGQGDHGETHGHDDHAHGDSESLGPVDVFAWGAGALGIVAGLAVALVMAVSTGWLG
jgi:hypothetical protein